MLGLLLTPRHPVIFTSKLKERRPTAKDKATATPSHGSKVECALQPQQIFPLGGVAMRECVRGPKARYLHWHTAVLIIWYVTTIHKGHDSSGAPQYMTTHCSAWSCQKCCGAPPARSFHWVASMPRTCITTTLQGYGANRNLLLAGGGDEEWGLVGS